MSISSNFSYLCEDDKEAVEKRRLERVDTAEIIKLIIFDIIETESFENTIEKSYLKVSNLISTSVSSLIINNQLQKIKNVKCSISKNKVSKKVKKSIKSSISLKMQNTVIV